jgi:excisionase family DNA binding protein
LNEAVTEANVFKDFGNHGPVDDGGPRLLTPEQVAERLQISRSKVYLLLQNDLPSLQIGRSRRVDADRLREWLRAKELV